MAVNVREKPKGSGVYWVFINHQGKRRSKKIGKDKRLAMDVAKKIQAKLVLNEFDFEKDKPHVPTFQEVAELWIMQPWQWKESTREVYEFNLNKHIFSVFGDIPVNEIKRKDLKVFYDNLYANGLTLGTIKLIRAPMNGVFSYAIELELIDSNPLRDLALKYKRNKVEINPLTESESLLLLERAKTFLNGNYYPSILCLLRTGMRIGELQALKWHDIDFDKRTIEIKRSFRKGRMTGTKNHNRRRVDMTPHLSETFKAHRTAQKRAALEAGRPFSEFVFTGTRNEMLNRISFKNALNRCLQKAGLRRISTHALRHSYATIRLMKGHNVGDVSYQLGHSSIKITYDVYAHWIPGKFKSEVDELDNIQPTETLTPPANKVNDIL